MPDPRRPRAASTFTAMDWIGVAVTGLVALGVILAPHVVAPPIVAMYEDFEATLPTITQLVITGWFPLLLGQLPLAALVWALLRRHSLLAARMLVLAGFLAALLGGATVWYGLYAPIFELAGAIEEAPSAAADPAPARIVAVGDLHGDLSATRRALRLAGAIDGEDRWSGGDLVLVQTGDAIDRGDEDREVLDLFARLVDQAARVGGRFVPLLGNHELMNAAGDLRYVTPRGFEQFADFPPPSRRDQLLPPPFPVEVWGRVTAFAPGGDYALELARSDVIATVGDTVFVHGAALPSHAEYGVDRINRETREWLRGARPELPAIMRREDAPVWDRRYSDEAVESDCAELERALALLSASRMVVGHEANAAGVTEACGGRVWRIDTGMSAFYGGPTEVLEIRGDDIRILGR